MHAKTHSIWKSLFLSTDPILRRAGASLLPLLAWPTAARSDPGDCPGRPGQHRQQLAVSSFHCGKLWTKTCLVVVSCLWCCFQLCGKRKDSQWPMPNKPVPAHLCTECGTEWPRSGWKPLQIFPSKVFWKQYLEGPLSRELTNCKWLWLPPVCVICSWEAVNNRFTHNTFSV